MTPERANKLISIALSLTNATSDEAPPRAVLDKIPGDDWLFIHFAMKIFDTGEFRLVTDNSPETAAEFRTFAQALGATGEVEEHGGQAHIIFTLPRCDQ